MSGFNDVKEKLSTLEKWQKVIFSAACTERVAPVARRLGHPMTVRTFDIGLDMLWKLGLGQSSAIDAASIKAELENLPEASEDDSHVPSYRVMLSLAVLAYSLDVLLSEDSLSPTKWVSEATMELLGGFDFMLNNSKGTIKFIRKGDLQEPRKLELAEMNAQKDSIELLSNMKQTEIDIIRDLQKNSQKFAQIVDNAIFTIAPRIGWTVNN